MTFVAPRYNIYVAQNKIIVSLINNNYMKRCLQFDQLTPLFSTRACLDVDACFGVAKRGEITFRFLPAASL